MNRLAFICFVFFLSGAAGLSYELLWVRLLSRFFGHTVYAVTTVLATFMGGLALGSALFGTRADRAKNSFRLYGLLELGIGASCLFVPFLLEFTRKLYIALYPSLGDNLLLRTLLQFLLSLVVLLIPATLMGGTLPAALRTVTQKSGHAGSDVALLYGSNTAGAAMGAIATGYLLLPTLGILHTNHIGVAINLVIGAWVVLRFRDVQKVGEAAPKRSRAVKAPKRKARHAAPLDPSELSSSLRRLLSASLFVSGALAMGYQIAWTRSLILVIGSSTYAFSSILVTFLIGMASGSFLFRVWPNATTPRFFALLQVAVGLSALLLIPFFNRLPSLFQNLFTNYEGGFGFILLSQFLIATPFILLPTFCMGMVFPCVLGMLSRESKRIGADSGRLYAFNTLGAITGSVLTGFVLLPQLGSQLTLTVSIACNLLLGASVLWFTSQPQRRLAVGVAVLAMVPLLLPSWDPVRMSLGASIYPRAYGGERDPFEVLMLREGVGSTVAVATTPNGGKSLRVNGKVDASTEPVDMLTQARLAYIPLLLHPEPRRVAIVGLGSGVTAGVAALFEKVEGIDVVELEPAVVEAAGHFSDRNYGVLSDPKVAIHIDDARSFLEVRKERYDVLISEPSNPWIAGVAALFSLEFMKLVKGKLASGGVFCQWIQTYSISPQEMKLIMRTFTRVFPDASLWRTSPADYALVGRKSDSTPILATRVERQLVAIPELRELLNSLDELPVESFWTSFRVGTQGLSAYAGEGPINTEDMLHLEFSAPRSLYKDHSKEIDAAIWEYKQRIFPHFVRSSPDRQVRAALQFGQYALLQGRQPIAATFYLRHVPALIQSASPGVASDTHGGTSAKYTPPRRKPVPHLREDFEGRPVLPYRDRLVGIPVRPGEDEKALTTAYELLFNRISGVVPGVGLSGSKGFQIHSLPAVKAVGFRFQQAVRPSTQYRLSWSMRIGKLGEGSVAVLAEQLATTDRGATQSLAISSLALMTAPQRWKTHHAEIETNEHATLLYIYISRAGESTPDPVVVDDIVLEELDGT